MTEKKDKRENPELLGDSPISVRTSRLELRTFGLRITELVGEDGARAFARRSGVSDKSIREYMSGDTDPSLTALRRIAATGGVRIEWLITGEGEKLTHDGNGAAFALIPQRDVDLSAGPGAFTDHEPEIGRLAFRRDWLDKIGVKPQTCVLVRVRGDSMEPTLRDGGLVLVNVAPEETRDGIYALLLDGGLVVKRLQRGVSGVLIVRSDNPAYGPIELTQDQANELRVIGRVLWAAAEI